MKRALDIFSGIGGWSLGLHRNGIETVAACEIDAWKRSHYARHFQTVRLYEDVTRLAAWQLARDGCLPIDIVVGSPPCTDISTANARGAGVGGPNSKLYFDAIRIIRELREWHEETYGCPGGPRWCILENSANLRARGSDRVLAALEAAGYTPYPLVVGAGHAGASHRRLRSWLVGVRVDLVGGGADAGRQKRKSGWREIGSGIAPGPGVDGPDVGAHTHQIQRRTGPRQDHGDGEQSPGRDCARHGPDTDPAGLRLEPGRGRRPHGPEAAEPQSDAADPDRHGQHGTPIDGEMAGGSGFCRHAVADRTDGGGNDADTDCAGLPLTQMLRRDDGSQLAAIERNFGLDWADGPGALALHLRAADGVSRRMAAAGRNGQRGLRRRIAAELASGRAAYGDAVAIPVVTAIIEAVLKTDATLPQDAPPLG